MPRLLIDFLGGVTKSFDLRHLLGMMFIRG